MSGSVGPCTACGEEDDELIPVHNAPYMICYWCRQEWYKPGPVFWGEYSFWIHLSSSPQAAATTHAFQHIQDLQDAADILSDDYATFSYCKNAGSRDEPLYTYDTLAELMESYGRETPLRLVRCNIPSPYYAALGAPVHSYQQRKLSFL